MAFYNEKNGFNEGKAHETVYHTGNGFYSQNIEPLWKKEKRLLRGAGNGIGLASLGYIAFSLFAGAFYTLIARIIFPASNIHGLLYISETTEWILNLLIYIFSLILPFGIYALCIKMPISVAIPFRKAKADLTLGGLLIGLGTGVLASYATSYLQLGLEYVGVGITMPEYETPITIPGKILYIITLTVAPAFIEEIVFRGIVMQSLRRFGDVFALIASALIFGIFHLNLIQMPYAFILGLCIGYFVIRTDSLWVGVLIHFVNNSVAVAFEFMYPYMSDEVYYMANFVYNLICVILSVIAIIAVLMKYKDMFCFKPSKTVLTSGKKTEYFLSSPALLIAMLAAVIMTMPYIYLM